MLNLKTAYRTISVSGEVIDELHEIKRRNALVSLNDVILTLLGKSPSKKRRWDARHTMMRAANHSWPFKDLKVGETVHVPLAILFPERYTGDRWLRAIRALERKSGRKFKVQFCGDPHKPEAGAHVTRIA